MTAAGAALAVGAVMILAALALAAQSAYYRGRRTSTEKKPCKQRLVFAGLNIPTVATSDGRPIGPEDLAAVSRAVWHSAHALAHHLHDEVMDAVLAQVASDESHGGLDDALTRLTDTPGSQQ